MMQQMRRESLTLGLLLVLLAAPVCFGGAGEILTDTSIQSSDDHRLLLFPAHGMKDILVNRPFAGLISVDLPFISFPGEPVLQVAPHPKIRLARFAQVSSNPDVTRVTFVFPQGIDMSPVVKDHHLYLEDSQVPRIPEEAAVAAAAPRAMVKLSGGGKPEASNILNQLVNLQFDQEDLSTILQALAMKFNLRVFSDAGVKGKFTINARDIPLRDVLKTLLLERSFQYTLKGRDLTIISLNQGSGRVARELLFKDLSLRDALQTLSKMMNINLILHESIKDKNVNFYVENLSLDELLELLIATNDLVKKPYNENTFIILTKEEAKKFGEKVYRTFKLVNAKPDEVIKMITGSKALADKIDTSNMAANDRISSLSVYDTPENLELISQVVRDVDEKVKQVTIELKLLEINSGSLKDLGVTFLDSAGKSAGGIVMSTADIGHLPTSISLPAKLEFLESTNKAKILSSPKIRVVHKKTASIHIGKSTPVPQSNVVNASGVAAINKTYTLVPTGISLDVTPEISHDNEISLDLKTKVNEIIGINEDSGQLTMSEKSTDTYVRVKDGETVVLGGLISQDEKSARTSPALLDKIPLFRKLFSKTHVDSSQSELIMLVTPHLVNLDPVEDEQKGGGLLVGSYNP